MKEKYLRQAGLVVRAIPHIAKEGVFALKGGTAINLFELDMPRLSVDIDLCYTKISDRMSSMHDINAALGRISERLRRFGIGNQVVGTDGTCKIVCSAEDASIKIEPNYILRGTVFPTRKMMNGASVQGRFGLAKMEVLSRAELYGGKFCAALDRQHPRDLFDVAQFYGKGGRIDEIKQGFLVCALSHNRPLHELLNPVLQDHRELFDQQFSGMTDLPFTYEMHCETFERLRMDVLKCLASGDRTNLLDFVSLKDGSSDFGIRELEKLPAIVWKRRNLERLRKNNPSKFAEQKERLIELFS